MEIITRDTKEKIIISDNIFNKTYNSSLIHQVIKYYQNIGRQGTKAQKSRGEVKGSGKKPWKQKGTGKARAGTVKSPLWRSGGVTFATKNKIYKPKINKKMYRNALKIIFSELHRTNRLILLQDFVITQPKTKVLITKLKILDIKQAFIITTLIDRNLFLASRNLYYIQVSNSININPVYLITKQHTLITINAIQHLEEQLQS
ncbi:50S ribosomal protein L4 [Enterobacteriaceae endosymbiont of Macroplea appendiculata]|uniref:50S ribosomal protein L4 n=1 Tax=Enterobacteriaceae endosymbiont of Macroplea appendiculata TaxID=2675790 RepID=UPI0014495E4C|nr:50S ribosomal protein L4 [Enterobacteriaceae endosymbiont of Macroplea appendiculata]QJC30885.1 50S ribosomal protein L4 [Enterobacteriaceae endosymbiont of Macroplea appendiculata]